MTEQTSEPIATKPWQAKVSRRRFIGGGAALAAAAAAAGYLPESVLRAQAKSAASRSSFNLSQVKHLVFLLQENRSFDHYFGTYPGVAGYSDPRAIKLPSGLSVFQQPDPANPDGYLEPFHISCITTGAAAIPDLTHNWQPQHQSWDFGAMDGWVRTHIAYDGPTVGPYTMGYYTQEDIPFHWALANAFTLCDQYHCSCLGPSGPNHMIWQNGTNDPQGLGGGPILETGTPPPLTFVSGAETMFAAGLSMHCYFGGGDTWHQFAKFMAPGQLPTALYNVVNLDKTTLFGDGTPGGIGDPNNPTLAANPKLSFEEDCANGVLADVSYVGQSLGATEHPSGLPAAGAQFLAQILDALAGNEDLWNTTMLVIQYDENDGFYDHVVPPTPNKAQFPEEFVTKASALGTPGGDLPVGFGYRVPCFIVSPWSTGGHIFSAPSDHASCLRLIEAVSAAGGLSGKGPVTFPNISPWRRSVTSDLTGALKGKAMPAPSSPQFDPAVRAANLAQQQASSTLPQPAFPGANQTLPVQLTSFPG